MMDPPTPEETRMQDLRDAAEIVNNLTDHEGLDWIISLLSTYEFITGA